MIALKTKNDEFLWFDVVMSMSESYSRSATSFPVQSGGAISDHIASQNQQISLTGVFTSSGFVKEISTIEGTTFEVQAVRPVTVNYNKPSLLQRLAPEGLSNLFHVATPVVEFEVEPQRSAEDKLEELLRIWKSKEDVTIIETDERNLLIKERPNLVITNIQKSLSPDDGDSLTLSLQFEEIRKVTLLVTQSPVVSVKDWRVVQQSAASGAKGTASGAAASDDEVPDLLGKKGKLNTHLLNYVEGTPGA